MTEYFKHEENGWFYLTSSRGAYEPWDDSLGRGSAMTVTRFQSDEGRTYFIQARQYEHAAKVAAHELEYLRAELRKLAKKRNVRKRIAELIGPGVTPTA